MNWVWKWRESGKSHYLSFHVIFIWLSRFSGPRPQSNGRQPSPGLARRRFGAQKFEHNMKRIRRKSWNTVFLHLAALRFVSILLWYICSHSLAHDSDQGPQSHLCCIFKVTSFRYSVEISISSLSIRIFFTSTWVEWKGGALVLRTCVTKPQMPRSHQIPTLLGLAHALV